MGASSSTGRSPPTPPQLPRRAHRQSSAPRLGARPARPHYSRASSSSGSLLLRPAGLASHLPQIRCYRCHELFHSRADLSRMTHHCRCPHCSAINGVPARTEGGREIGIAAIAAALTPHGPPVLHGPPALETEQRDQLLRRLQSREISPLELLILREFVEHLQQNRNGANLREVEQYTAEWHVDDVSKLPEELRSCCVCLEDVCQGQRVRTLPCLHTFHADCVEEWLKNKKTCPLCQFSIDSNEDFAGSSN